MTHAACAAKAEGGAEGPCGAPARVATAWLGGAAGWLAARATPGD